MLSAAGARVALCASTLPQPNPPRGMGGQASFDRLRLNLRASWVQGKPRKTKEKSLHFLGFSWPNLDFSKGYGESK
jgi:hypothetical protein